MPNSPSLTWLSLDDRTESAIYEAYWEKSRSRRPHDHPAYLYTVRPEHHTAWVVIYRHSETANVTYPIFSCELNRLEPFRELRQPMHHLVSPYGYGGPLYEGEMAVRKEASETFERLLNADLQRRGFVSEFIREDIFSLRLARRVSGRLEQYPNVTVRLERSPEEIWRGYKHSTRGNVNRAYAAGLRVAFDPAGDRLDRFLDLYYETMRRREALSFFYFPKERFQYLLHKLGKHKGVTLAHVYDGDEIVSSELLLLSRDTIYSFLNGSLPSAFSKRPNNLLKHEVILWGARNGYKWLVLGGGSSPGDELLRFKKGFDPQGIVPFGVRQIIHDRDTYDQLVQARLRYETRRCNAWQANSDFFPEYLS